MSQMPKITTKLGVKRALQEFFASYIFIFSVLASIIYSQLISDNVGIQVLICSLTTAASSYVVLVSFGSEHGPHFNPAVTIGQMLGVKLNIWLGLVYLVVQFLASMAAAGTQFIFFPDGWNNQMVISDLMGIQIPKGSTPLTVFIAETILIAILVISVGSTAGDNHEAIKYTRIPPAGAGTNGGNAESGQGIAVHGYGIVPGFNANSMFASTISAALFFLVIIGGVSSGSAVNFMRVFGPTAYGVIFSGGTWGYIWVYAVSSISGPIIGAMIAYGLFGGKRSAFPMEEEAVEV